ncbi:MULTISPECIES: carbohydrate ABC transporter permease [unclassified Modestobacter]|uniref:carbohydrate ABC transporter permease n=1 Tax=unclassified Modestobacter TaxID=2643866 RepID=UPI0022AAC11D|nr:MULTISPECIES: carbohydrate ABC transporter permease [unclassified Modestobacter]MCZ2812130.1 carbohydrate ABC transporter permease [Modestobacter sp. VKM Ac-2979]MCZ2843854.1 carbohydrate ABC transporter permease [Modestobacter sp. VKM Ac-2980]MCZ2849698.1 carbohydrate ABC transporter permease [Modestobacter sp. VKM Ac-2978]
MTVAQTATLPEAPAGATAAPPVRRRRGGSSGGRRERPNWLAGVLATCWLVIVAVPLYYLVAASFRTRQDYLSTSPLKPPTDPTIDNYVTVFEGGFLTYLINNVIVTVATVAIVVAVTVPAAYAVARNAGALVQRFFSIMLIGLAIPAQATIIPVYLLITQMRLYDTLLAIILPTAAFALPVALLVMTNSLRDIPKELYEAQTLDGAGPLGVLRNLVLPLAKPAITTISVFTALNAWNGFLFPLVLTQSESTRVLTLGLWDFQGQFGTNVPGLLAAVTLSVVPIFVLYLVGRRYLLSGLTAGFGK